MPSPFLGFATLAILYVVCLAVSFLINLIYSKKQPGGKNEQETAATEPSDDVFYFERVRRRRRKKRNETIAVRGKIIDENDKTSA